MNKPNFLLILVDQMRKDNMGHSWPEWRQAGQGPKTPHLDGLAREGTSFARAYSVHPYCMPARATLVTGLMPSGHGVRTNGINLSPHFPTLPGALADAGYRTHCVGKTHFNTWSFPAAGETDKYTPADYPESEHMWNSGRIRALPLPYYGYQQVEFVGGHGQWIWGDYFNWLKQAHPQHAANMTFEKSAPASSGAKGCYQLRIPAAVHYNTWIADRSIEFLKRATEDKKGKAPFFLCASFPDPHAPWAAPDPWFSLYPRAKMPAPVGRPGEHDQLPEHLAKAAKQKTPSAEWRPQLADIMAITYGMISFVDEQIGRLMAELGRLGLEEDTVIVFAADHGEMLGDHGLVGKGPYGFNGVLNIPYIWRAKGRFAAQGKSQALVSQLDFVPTVLELAGLKDLRYSTAPAPGEYKKTLTGRSRLPLLTGKETHVNQAILVEDDDDWLGARLRTLVTEQHTLTAYIRENGLQDLGLFFDLKTDPGQTNNLWKSAAHQSLKQELLAQLAVEQIRVMNRSPVAHTSF
jgi:arylsulfatase A-like enzyme